ncbi:hypothetical protein SSAG_00283 [Streptomyces sp. Mg1]|nr:hypothetical protein SSAG_00283 [Streptomyces sp. Mg1]
MGGAFRSSAPPPRLGLSHASPTAVRLSESLIWSLVRQPHLHRPVSYHRRLQRVFHTSALVSVRYDPNLRKF